MQKAGQKHGEGEGPQLVGEGELLLGVCVWTVSEGVCRNQEEVVGSRTPEPSPKVLGEGRTQDH